MNEVETELRRSGKWWTPITTDSQGRATQGDWWPRYYAAWIDTHGATRDETGLKPATWCRDDDYHEWWVTDTPEWDHEWFTLQGVKPPKRFGNRANTHWKDYGDGLKGLVYRNAKPEHHRWWTRLRNRLTGGQP